MRLYRILVAALALTLASCSPKMPTVASMQEHMTSNPELLDGNYRPYVFTDWSDKAIEKDFEAFYISHYGRHGSRFCTTQRQYDKIYKVLSTAADEDNLTVGGQSIPLSEKKCIRIIAVCSSPEERYLPALHQ